MDGGAESGLQAEKRNQVVDQCSHCCVKNYHMSIIQLIAVLKKGESKNAQPQKKN